MSRRGFLFDPVQNIHTNNNLTYIIHCCPNLTFRAIVIYLGNRYSRNFAKEEFR